MNRITKTTTAITVVALAAIGAGAAMANSSLSGSASQLPTEAKTSNAASQWAGKGSAPNATDLKSFDRLLPAFDDSLVNGTEDASFDLGAGKAVTVAATKLGGLCFRASRDNTELSAGCFPKFSDGGTTLVYRFGTNMPEPVSSDLVGVVAQDVTALSATLDDGSTRDVPITNGVVLWTAPDGRQVDSYTSVRNGEKFTQSVRDVS